MSVPESTLSAAERRECQVIGSVSGTLSCMVISWPALEAALCHCGDPYCTVCRLREEFSRDLAAVNRRARSLTSGTFEGPEGD